MATDAILGIGIYTPAEAARLTGVHADQIRRWLWGYSYTTREGERRSGPPLWKPQHPVVDGFRSLGFKDLIELRFVDAFRRQGVSMRVVRQALEEAERLFQTTHPFSSYEFKTDGKKIFANVREHPKTASVLYELISGQHLFDFVLPNLYRGLKYEGEELAQWRPQGFGNEVYLDPRKNFGRPAVERGVPTDVLAAACEAEESCEAAAKLYSVSEKAVRDAVEFERKLAA